MGRPLRMVLFGLLLTALAALALLGGVYLRRHRTVTAAPQTTVTFLDVGDGDCALVRTVNGTTLLVDTGSAARAAETVRALHKMHIHAIDLLVLAGPDDGNLGAVSAILDNFVVRSVWDGASAGTGAARRAALEAIRRRHVPSRIARAGDNVQIGAATFWAAVWPPPSSKSPDRLVCRLDFGRTRFLLAGAADADTENALLAGKNEQLGCDGGTGCTDLVLQAGARTSPELLWQAAPSVTIVSQSATAGQTPSANALARRVEAAGTALWRTDTQGTITVRTDGRAPPDVSAELLK